MNDSTMPGGWTAYSTDISKEAQGVFDAVTKHLLGVKYEPVAVATQVVAGLNYSYFCNAQVVKPESPWYPVIIDVYKPLNEDPRILEIKKLQQ